MGNVLKIAGKIGLVFLGSVVIGYTEYRLKGGKPLRVAYREAQAKINAEKVEEAKKAGTIIQAEGTVG